jgi:hypothetical protein
MGELGLRGGFVVFALEDFFNRFTERFAILNASGALRSYLPVSIAFTVCRETFSRTASLAGPALLGTKDTQPVLHY